MAIRYPFPSGPLVDSAGRPTLPGKAFLAGIRDTDVRLQNYDVQTTLTEQAVDPADPIEGQSVIWQSDGTGAGDDGDIMIKITAGGVTKTATLVDYSAV